MVRQSVKVNRGDLVPMVANATIAGQIAEGANVPLVILDTSGHPKVAAVIRAHAYLAPGDVRSVWAGLPERPDDVLLVLDFERPMEVRAVLYFSIEREGILVDAALTAKALYLQEGKPGDRFSDDPDRPKVLIELPDTGFQATWNDLFLKGITRAIRRDGHLTHAEAAARAAAAIVQLRAVTTFRMPQR